MLGTEDIDYKMDNDYLQKIKGIFSEDSYEEDKEEENEDEVSEENKKEDEEAEVTITNKDHGPVAVSKLQWGRRTVGKYQD
jgi:hypothetical protein